MPLYEPRFYERAAQHHVTRLFPDPVFINVRWGLSGSLATRHELDALVLQTRQVTPVEIKAHSLSAADTDEIVAKYRRIGFRHVIIIAPAMSIETGRRLTGSRAPSVGLILFHPDLDAIRDWILRHMAPEGARVDSCRLGEWSPPCAFCTEPPREPGPVCHWSATDAGLFRRHRAASYGSPSLISGPHPLDTAAFYDSTRSHRSQKQGHPHWRFCVDRHRRRPPAPGASRLPDIDK